MEQLQYRFCVTNATTDDSIAFSGPDYCSQNTFDYMLSQPTYKDSWYEIRGGIFGPDWVKVDDIILIETNENHFDNNFIDGEPKNPVHAWDEALAVMDGMKTDEIVRSAKIPSAESDTILIDDLE